MDKSPENTARIKEKALELGFLDCGIAKADYLEDDSERLRSWLEHGRHGDMQYMENHFDKRVDPGKLVEGARSVIILLQNYHTKEKQVDPGAPVISRYAYGKDYHKIVRKKLNALLKWMQQEMGPVSGRAFVDSAPVMERAWGRISGLGWIGKHSLLLNRKYGSWFFLGVIICDLDLEPGKPMNDYCGDCTRCVDECPTGAILPGRTVDTSRCISYLTIEYKQEQLPDEFRNRMKNRVFGCDICQDVCPWNNNAHPHDEPGLKPMPGLLDMSRDAWMNMDEKAFNRVFKGSPVKRTKYAGLRRNLDFLK
jgi:epoxyqueuosine reductase